MTADSQQTAPETTENTKPSLWSAINFFVFMIGLVGMTYFIDHGMTRIAASIDHLASAISAQPVLHPISHP